MNLTFLVSKLHKDKKKRCLSECADITNENMYMETKIQKSTTFILNITIICIQLKETLVQQCIQSLSSDFSGALLVK